MNTPDQLPLTQINDPHLAETMAYAEKPYQDLALAAQESGLMDEVTDLRAKANTVGINAGIATIEPSRMALIALQARNTAPKGEGQQEPEHAFLPAPSPEHELVAPKLGKNGGAVVARAVAMLATLSPDQRYAQRVVNETGFATATVGSIFDELTSSGFLVSAGKAQSKVPGPKPNLFDTTEQFDHYLQGVPDWRRAYNLRVMAERLGRDEDATMDYLLSIGEASVLAAQAAGSTK